MSVSIVKSATYAAATADTTVTLGLGSSSHVGNVLIAIVNAGATFSTPAGFTAATTSPVDYVQTGLFYKTITSTSQTSVTVSFSSATASVIRLYELSGISALDDATSTSMGSNTSATITAGPTNASTKASFGIAVVGSLGTNSSLDSGGVSSWGNGYVSDYSGVSTVSSGDNDRLNIAFKRFTAMGGDSTIATFANGVNPWHANAILGIFQTTATISNPSRNVKLSGGWSSKPLYTMTSSGWFPNPTSAVSAPGAPTNVSASPGDGQATVTWSAPADDGNSAITQYTVTSSPGAITATTNGATSTTMRGLTNGTAYTFKVKATNAVGDSPYSASSTAITPSSTSGTILDGRDINETNTGYRGSLTKHTGDWYTSDGLPNGLEITGQLVVDSPTTQVMQDFWAYLGIKQQFNAAGSTFEHFTLGMPNGAYSGDYAIVYGGYTARYGNIYGFSDGPHVDGDASNPTLLEWCYIHDLVQGDPSDHNDGIQMTNGSYTTIRGVRINRNDGLNQTSCIILGADLGSISNVLIEKCYFEASIPNFQVCLYWGHDSGSSYTATALTVQNNWFKKNTFTTIVSANDSYTSSNNKYLDGTTAIPDGTN